MCRAVSDVWPVAVCAVVVRGYGVEVSGSRQLCASYFQAVLAVLPVVVCVGVVRLGSESAGDAGLARGHALLKFVLTIPYY